MPADRGSAPACSRPACAARASNRRARPAPTAGRRAPGRTGGRGDLASIRHTLLAFLRRSRWVSIRDPSWSSTPRTSRRRPVTLPWRSTGSDVVMKRLPSLATQCGSMRWAMYSRPRHRATAATTHSTLHMSPPSVPGRGSPTALVLDGVGEERCRRHAEPAMIGGRGPYLDHHRNAPRLDGQHHTGPRRAAERARCGDGADRRLAGPRHPLGRPGVGAAGGDGHPPLGAGRPGPPHGAARRRSSRRRVPAVADRALRRRRARGRARRRSRRSRTPLANRSRSSTPMPSRSRSPPSRSRSSTPMPSRSRSSTPMPSRSPTPPTKRVVDEPALEPAPGSDQESQPVIEPSPGPVAPEDREAAASASGHASHEPVAAPESS